MTAAPVQLTPGAVAVGVGVLVGGFLLWRASQVAGQAGDYLASLPGRIGDTISEGAKYASESLTSAGDALMPQYVVDNGGLWETNLAVVNSVNPASDTNLIYRGVNAVGGAAAGVADWTLGGAFYDWFNPTPPQTGGATGSW